MSLEQRVVVVEQELQILKTQIQVILLKIQEHLLNNTYPALQANEARPAAPSVAAAQAAPSHSNVVKRVAIDDDDFETEVLTAERPSRPGYREESHPLPRPTINEPKSAGQPYQTADVRLWIELDKWVNQKVAEVGIQRTRELISLFEGPEQDLLMQVAAIYDTGPELVRPPRSVPTPIRQNSVPQSRAVAEDWQKYANPGKVGNATYRPFGEHQELALRLIADILSSEEPVPASAASNGHAKH